jgi:hypothetical protein
VSTHPHEDVQKSVRRRYARVPDGRIGKVVGYYGREHESVLVRFASGVSTEFLTAEVELFL